MADPSAAGIGNRNLHHIGSVDAGAGRPVLIPLERSAFFAQAEIIARIYARNAYLYKIFPISKESPNHIKQKKGVFFTARKFHF